MVRGVLTLCRFTYVHMGGSNSSICITLSEQIPAFTIWVHINLARKSQIPRWIFIFDNMPGNHKELGAESFDIVLGLIYIFSQSAQKDMHTISMPINPSPQHVNAYAD